LPKKVVLAYSGGLDTSVAIRWLAEKYDAEVVTLTIDLGGQKDLEEVRARALKTGAVKAYVVDGKEMFVQDFVFPAFQAGAVYQGQYPLATALGRPLIAKLLVEMARKEDAQYVAHGCTGKGNDQVRFDVSVGALAPELKVIAPAREWGMSREEEEEYARRHHIPLVIKKGLYSTDENLWGRSIEAGPLEDPWREPPEEAFDWTRAIADTPDQPLYLEVAFEQGLPIALDGEEMDGVALINRLNALAGEHGVGRIDHIEDRLVGIKSREVYEAPAATVLLKAHQALEAMTLSRDQLRFKAKVSEEYAELIYNGLWFGALRRDLAAYVGSTQQHVTGSIRVRLHKGNCTVVGRRASQSLYRYDLATYGAQDAFDQKASPGFIHIWGLQTRIQAQQQPEEPPDA